jgi:hypothetical protein
MDDGGSQETRHIYRFSSFFYEEVIVCLYLRKTLKINVFE